MYNIYKEYPTSQHGYLAQDYTCPITTTAKQHIKNIEYIIASFDDLGTDFKLENMDILDECRRTIEKLKKMDKRKRITLEYQDGLNYFLITE